MGSIDRYVRRQARIERDVFNASTRAQLPYSAIDGGSLEIKDEFGQTQGVIGQQWDGTNTVASVGGAPPAQPTIPLVTPKIAGLSVYWDGTYADGSVTRMDFQRVTVHAVVGDPSLIDPTNPAQIIGEITYAGGAEIYASLPTEEHYVALVAWTDSGKFSVESDIAFGTPIAAVDPVMWAGHEDSLANLNDVALPALEADLAANAGAIDNLNTVTLPGLEAELDAALAEAVAAQAAADAAAADAAAAQAAADAAAAEALEAFNEAAAATTTANAAKAAADGAIRTFGPEEYPTSPPWPNGSVQPDSVIGDLWLNSDGVAHRWNGTTWYAIPDSAAAAALSAANTAQEVADAAASAAAAAQLDVDAAEARVTTAEGEISSVKTRVTTAEGTLSSVDSRVATAETAVSNHESRIDTAEGSLTTVTGRLTSAESTINTHESRIDTAETDISTVESNVSTVAGNVGTLTTRVTTAEGTVTNHESRIDVAETSISTHETRLDGAEDDISTVTTIAQGKNKTTYSTNAPGSAANAIGDTWFRLSGSEVIGVWKGNGGTSWSEQKYGGAVLDHLDAGTITAGVIAAARIAAGTIATGHLASDAVTAAKIQAGSIDTTKIVTAGLDAATIKFGTMSGARIEVGTLTVGAVSGLQGTLDSKETPAGAQAKADAAKNAAVAAAELASSITGTGSSRVIHNPLHFSTGGENISGKIVITTPIVPGGKMARFAIKGYNYQSGKAEIDLSVSAYIYQAGSFLSHSQTNRGTKRIKATLATNAAGTLDIILETIDGTGWYYPLVYVETAAISYQAFPDSWKDGWTAVMDTDALPAYSYSMVPTFIDAAETTDLVSGWRTTGQTTIDGGKITADSITAAQIKAGSITIGPQSGTSEITYAAGYDPSTKETPTGAQAKATAAQQAAISAAATDAQNKATAAETAAKTYADAEAEAARASAVATASGDATDKATAAEAAAKAAAALDASQKANAARDAAILASTKVGNPTQTGVVAPWVSNAGSTLAIEDVTFEGRTMKAMKFAATGTNTASSGYFSVDTTKTYEIRFRVKDPTLATGTQFYFGLNVLNNAGVNVGIETVPVATGVPGAVSGNFYHFYSSGVHADFTEYVAYIFPTGATAAQMKGLGNVQNNARFLPGTNRAQVRFLNWSNTGPTRNLWLSDITVTEANAIIASNEATGLVNGWRITGQTTINGGKIEADSIKAAQIGAGEITAEEIKGRTITALEIASGTLTANEIKAHTITAEEIASRTITAEEIEANAITANEIKGETITADEIAADAISATHIQTGAVEAGHIDVEYLRSGFTLTGRVQVGESYWTPAEGLVIPQPNGGRIQLPADGVTPARFDGQANLDAATIRGNMNIMGATNKISGQLGLAAGITEPTVAPSVYQSWPTVTNTHVNGGDAGWRVYNGMTTHHSNSTLATAAVCYGSGGLAFFNKTTGAWAGNMPDQTYMNDYMPWGGVAFQNGHYFTYGYDSTRNNWFIYKINPTTWAKVGEIQVTTDSSYHQNATPAITASAGMVQIASFVKGTAGQMRLQRWYADTLAFWNYNDFAVYGTNQNIAAATIHAADNGVDTLWIGVEGERRFRAYPMDTLVETTNLSFGFAAGANAHGLMWDPAISRFRSYDKSGNLHTYSSHKTNQAITASNTWYDGAGTVRETREGPVASFTLPARSHLSIETPVPPDSGNTDAAQVDKANRVKIYVATGANARRLQATLGVDANGVSLRTATLDVISTGTALTPVSNTFVGGLTSPGKIVSGATSGGQPLLEISGDGSIKAATLNGRALEDTGWVNIAYATGWSNYASGWAPLSVRRLNGIVYMRGMVQAANGYPGAPVGTLPVGYRPAFNNIYLMQTGGGPREIYVNSSGVLQFPGNSFWGTWLSMATPQWIAEQ